MAKAKLSPELLAYLINKLGQPESTIRSALSRLRHEMHDATLNAVAQVYAQKHSLSVRRFLSVEDKHSLPHVKIVKPLTVRKAKKKPSKSIKELFTYATEDPFLKKHFKEIHLAYANRCYTCVFVLSRKVLENLIISILKENYPHERTLFEGNGRYHDFSVVLENLFQKRNDFDSDGKKAIERLNQKLKPFKKDANDKAHSLYHIVENATEIDDLNLDTIFELIPNIKKGESNGKEGK